MTSRERVQNSKRTSTTTSHNQSTLSSSNSQGKLPEKIDTKKVVEMIRNADLYDLINISLRSSELKNETVELFIQKALQKAQSGQKSQHQSILAQIMTEPENIIFTPPTKSQRQQQHQNQTAENNENQPNLKEYAMFLKQQQQLLRLQQQHQQQQRQNLLQPSILENSQIPNSNFQQQLTLSCQQLEEFLLQKRLSLDEDTGFQIPRDQIPQPYSEQPTSPGEEENQSFSQQIESVMQSYKKVAQTSSLATVQEVGYKGDQFSFQVKRRESLLKKSPQSNYSSKQRLNEQSFRGSSTKRSPTNYEQQLKLQHSQKYQNQATNQDEKHQLNRTLSNFRVFQQQQQQPMTRSVSQNCIQTTQAKTPSNKTTSQQPTLSSLSKSFLNTSRGAAQSHLLESELTQNTPSNNKTPRAFQAQLTSRANQDNTVNSLLQSMSDMRKSIDSKKANLLASFQQMNIKYLIELERIKKPSQLAYVTGRLVCQFFAIFKDHTIGGATAGISSKSHNHQIHMEDLIEWVDIQKHINSQIIKYTSELLSIIKTKVINNENNPSQIIEAKLTQLKQEYFTGDNLKLFKHVSSNKTLQVIVTFIHNVILYYLEMAENSDGTQQPEQTTVNQERYSELKSVRSQKFIHDKKDNYDALILTQKLKQSTLNYHQAKRSSRNLQLPSKNDTTPIATTINSTFIKTTQDKSPTISSSKQSLQKSASRCLLQRRDRSQIIQKDSSYCSNKSPMMKNSTVKDLNKVADIKKQEASIKRSHSKQQLSTSSKSPINLLSSVSRKINFEDNQQRTREEIKERLSQIVEQQQEFTQRNSINMFFPIDFNQEQNQEAPIDFDYKVMVEASGLSQLIKETAESIEKNMKVAGSPSKKQIDMTLIEQIKARRKEQKQREVSEERFASNLQSNKKLQDQL